MMKAFLALLSLLCIASAQPYTVYESEYLALEYLYISTGGPSWTSSTNWFIGDPCTNNWYGVTCSPAPIYSTIATITSLSLPNNNLVGTIPPEIGGLINAATINLSGNSLSGSIPADVQYLTAAITIDFSNNQLTGEIPYEISNAGNLKNIYLNNNMLYGQIPPSIPTIYNITDINFSHNSLSGTIPDFSSSPFFTTLTINNNILSGTVPSQVASYTTYNIDYNRFCKPLPSGVSCTACTISGQSYYTSATCVPQITTNLDSSGASSITAASVAQNAQQYCNYATYYSYTLSLSTSSFSCSNLGTPSLVSLTVHESNYNDINCYSQVTVIDTIAPTPSCSATFSLALNTSGLATLSTTDISSATPKDNCASVFTPTLSLSKFAFNCSDFGINSVNLIATDGSGNQGSCTTKVNVTSTFSVVCAASHTITLSSSQYDLNVSALVTFTDYCGVPVSTANKTSFNCNNVGTNYIMVVTADTIGNSYSCVIPIIVQLPTFSVTCPSSSSVSLNSKGTAVISTTSLLSSSSFVCGQTLSLSASPSYVSCSTSSPVTVTLTASYGSNVTTCTIPVTITSGAVTATCNQNIPIYVNTTTVTLSNTSFVETVSSTCPLASSVVTPPTIAPSSIGSTQSVSVSLKDTVGKNGGCSSKAYVVHLGLLTIPATKAVATPFNMTWNPNFASLSGTVTLSYQAQTSSSAPTVTIGSAPYSQGHFFWKAGFPRTLPLYKVYSVLMTVGGNVEGLTPVFLY